MTREVKFDIALSFAGEDRNYVEKVANLLKERGVSVFYDKFEEAHLWGKNLYDYLSDIYSNQAFYTIIFISENYQKKLWTGHERQAMQSRAFQENREYILPARFDQTDIPGILPTIGYQSLANQSPEDFVEIIYKKLVLSGRTVPSENVRKSLSPLIKVPKITPSSFQISIKDEKSNPVENAEIFLIADNNTYLEWVTSKDWILKFEINTRRSYKMYFSHENFPALINEKIDPVNDLEIQVHSSENIGSKVYDTGGIIPGLKGWLNPILDTSFRTYLYASNIAINGGKQQPVTFKVNEPLDLEDCDGVIMQVTIKDIQGRCSLIEYVKPITQ